MVRIRLRLRRLSSALSVLALSSRFDGRGMAVVRRVPKVTFSTRSVESF